MNKKSITDIALVVACAYSYKKICLFVCLRFLCEVESFPLGSIFCRSYTLPLAINLINSMREQTISSILQTSIKIEKKIYLNSVNTFITFPTTFIFILTVFITFFLQ